MTGIGTRERQALLLVDHGSRQAAANQQLEEIAEHVRRRRPELIVEIAHMELAEPDIATGIARCAAAGASEIIVHPYFLGPGKHTRGDIPAMVTETAAQHPGVTIRVSEPLGVHEQLIDVVLCRFDEANDSAVSKK